MIQPDWQRGGVKLYRGDSLDVLRMLDGIAVDAVITDPPYSSGGFTHAARCAPPEAKYVQDGQKRVWPTFQGDGKDGRSWCHWCAIWAELCRGLCHDGAYLLMFCDWRQMPLASDALQMGGWIWRGTVVWDKGLGSRAPNKAYFRHQCEYVLWGSKGQITRDQATGPWPGCFHHSVRQNDKYHMTGKPTPLMDELVRVAPAGSLILDPFMGSGTTGVAAVRAGHRFVGIEMSEAYFDVAVGRLEEALGQKEQR